MVVCFLWLAYGQSGLGPVEPQENPIEFNEPPSERPKRPVTPIPVAYPPPVFRPPETRLSSVRPRSDRSR